MPLILGTNSIKDTGYDVANSLRFNGGSSDYLNRTNVASPTNQFKWTFSFWLKISDITDAQGSGNQMLFSDFTDASNRGTIFLESDDTLVISDRISNSFTFKYQTTRKFRDPSAWFHIVVNHDRTLSSPATKVFVNGVQETSFSTSTNPSQNGTSFFNKGSQGSLIGKYGGGNEFYNGYICEAIWIDGSVLDADQFGEFDEDSPTIWKPKDVSGLTFGNNGFYLDFENASSLGADVSGNSNNFTVNNLTSEDSSTDTCTNNFAVLNSLVKAPSSITFSEGNLKAVHPGSWTGVPATIGVQSGKWYWECKITTGNSANAFTGICVEDINFNDSTVYDETGMITYFANGRKTVDGTETASFFSSLATNDIVGVALDLDSGTRTVTFTKNGSASGSAVNLTSNFDNKFIFPVGIGNSSSATANWEFNFGSPSYTISSGNSDGNGYGNFEYAVPSGHYALNTKNLAEFG